MNDLKISIRLAWKEDLNEIQTLFVETVSLICKKDYTPEQIKVRISSIERFIMRWKKFRFVILGKKPSIIFS